MHTISQRLTTQGSLLVTRPKRDSKTLCLHRNVEVLKFDVDRVIHDIFPPLSARKLTGAVAKSFPWAQVAHKIVQLERRGWFKSGNVGLTNLEKQIHEASPELDPRLVQPFCAEFLALLQQEN